MATIDDDDDGGGGEIKEGSSKEEGGNAIYLIYLAVCCSNVRASQQLLSHSPRLCRVGRSVCPTVQTDATPHTHTHTQEVEEEEEKIWHQAIWHTGSPMIPFSLSTRADGLMRKKEREERKGNTQAAE